MVHTPRLYNYRGLGKLKGSATHKTGGLSNLRERGGIKKNMVVLVGSVVLHSVDNLPVLDKDVVNSSLTASSDSRGVISMMTPTPALNITMGFM